MTQEEKNLLLEDICCRLPYGVKVHAKYIDTDVEVEKVGVLSMVDSDAVVAFTTDDTNCYNYVSIHEVKPYLFPMSSMNEEQKKECNFADDLDSDILDAALCTNHYHRTGVPTVTYNLVDWCIKNHFDFRGLIVKGIAIDATDKNIY